MEAIPTFVYQITIVFLLVNTIVNLLKPFWQNQTWQATADMIAGLVLSVGLCTLFRVDGIKILLGVAFPEAITIPWYVGTILTGLLGEKLAALLQSLTKAVGARSKI